MVDMLANWTEDCSANENKAKEHPDGARPSTFAGE